MNAQSKLPGLKTWFDDYVSQFSSGCDAPGTILKKCSREFLDIFGTADVIMSKGQGNFESLSGEEVPIFFLLKVTCPVIARHLGKKTDKMIVKDGRLQEN